MSKFGAYGRTGNQLFQWAFLSSLARKKNTTLVLPPAPIEKYFENFPAGGPLEKAIKIDEPTFAFNPEFYDNLDYEKADYDFTGYWQNEKYFDEKIRDEIKFKNSFVDYVKKKYSDIDFDNSIAIGIRRTDYLNSNNYYRLNENYYITAIESISCQERMCKLFISDDPGYCERHYSCLPGARIIRSDPMEQMCLMSLCKNIVIANSTFHWWAAWLGEKEKSKIIIQPEKLFSGKLLEKNGDINFYTSRWRTVKEKKIDLKDVTFTIPVKIDSRERYENLRLIVCLLQKHFDTNIIVGELGSQASDIGKYVEYTRFNFDFFHRTKMLNIMAMIAKTPIIANWDADVICPPAQIMMAVDSIRKGSDMSYPYEYKFMRIPRKHFGEIFPHYDIGVFSKYDFATKETKDNPSYGGAVFWNKESFIKTGGENENMISFGPEDIERYVRAKKLGMKISRMPGYLYHFDHPKKSDSSPENPFFKKNKKELEKILLMNKKELAEYIIKQQWISSSRTGTIVTTEQN